MSAEKNFTSKTEIAEYFLDNFGFGAFRIDAEGNLLYANSKLLQMLGFDFDFQLHDKINHDEIFRKNIAVKKYFDYIENHFSSPIESRWLKNNGQTILFREFIKAVKNKDGQIVFFDCILEDITEGYILENLFQDITAWSYSILKALPDSIFILTSEGQVLDFRNVPHAFQTGSNSLIGKSLTQIFSVENAKSILRYIEQTLADGLLHTLDISVTHQEDRKFFEARLVVCGPNRVMMVLRDTTQRMKAELELKETSEKLRVLNNTKDRFMSIIAHDLRTPINGLLGYSEILNTEIEDLSQEEIREFASSISEIALSANKLLANLLEWSRIQSGRITFRPSGINLYSVVERVFGLLHANASNKMILLVNKIQPKVTVVADENMLEVILLNLVGNAIKFTKENGEVEITALNKNNVTEICVKDNGIGIPFDVQSKIFDNEQLYTTLGTKKEKGTGLGLLLCKEFVEKHGGKISVISSQQEGTRFYFTLVNEAGSTA